MSNAGKVFAGALLAALAWAVAPAAQAQSPMRIGASVAQTGDFDEQRERAELAELRSSVSGFDALDRAPKEDL